MVKFSFFTVRSKCCKKSKFVVLFLFFFCLLDLKFSNSIYTAFTFFFCLFLRFSLWLLLLPSINVFFSSSVERSLFSLCVCAFSHSLFFLFRVSTRPWPRTVSKNACANNPQQPTNRKKRFPGEGETLLSSALLYALASLSLSLSFPFFLSSWSERTRARRESVQRCSALARRATNRPRDSERIEDRTRWDTYAIYFCLISLSFWSKIPALSLITTSI